MRFETLQIHAGTEPDGPVGARQTPIYPGNAFLFDSFDRARDLFSLEQVGPIYTRMGNPTVDVLERRVCDLERCGAAVAFASGQAAETALFLNCLRSGDHVVASPVLYGGTFNLLKDTLGQLGIHVTFVANPEKLASWERSIRPETRLVFTESIGNPTNAIYDYEGIGEMCREQGVLFCVDNTAASPYLFCPADIGANLVVHSASKFLGGHGVAIGGLVLDAGNFDYVNSSRYQDFVVKDRSYGVSFTERFGPVAFAAKLRTKILRDTGAAMSPFTAWALLQGIETLSLRMERHVSNAFDIATWLESQEGVSWVKYAGLPSNPYYELSKRFFPRGAGAVFCFELVGGFEAAASFVESLQLFSHAANIGDLRSLVMHPASTTHSQMSEDEKIRAGVSPGMIRLSIGLEAIEDLLEDLSQAFMKLAR